jgi:hypothetical protein
VRNGRQYLGRQDSTGHQLHGMGHWWKHKIDNADPMRKPSILTDNEICSLIIMMEDIKGEFKGAGDYKLPEFYETIRVKLQNMHKSRYKAP